MTDEASIQRFSTRDLPQRMRYDYWMSILNTSLWPVTEWTVTPEDFNVELSEARLGCISALTETITPSRAHRTPRDVDRTADSFYHLFANRRPWAFEHQGRHGRLDAGDVLILAEGEHTTDAPEGFCGVILKIPARWMRTWLPDPDAITARSIGPDTRWGRVLAPMVQQMTPELAAAPPLPQEVLVDQLGAVLSLVADDDESRAERNSLGAILDCIRERCRESQLTASDVAASLRLPPEFVHRVLASNRTTFAARLLDARIDVALHLMTSPACERLSTGDLARRCGFSSPSYFSWAMRRHTGCTPQALRRGTH